MSVDVETSGPTPSGHALLSIGACLVDDPAQGFYVELRPDRDGVDPGALAISGLDPAVLARTATPPAEAMGRFAAWVDAVTPDDHAPVFVGHNAGFDWMFVADYFQRYLGRNPFGHAALDLKSFALGLRGGSWRETSLTHLAPLFLRGRELSHNALEDARDQAELFRAMRAHRTVGQSTAADTGAGTHDGTGAGGGR